MNLNPSQARFTALEIEISTACNRSCSYCPNGHFRQARDETLIQPELYLCILRELQSLSYSGRLSFHFYNEPLMHPEIVTLVSRARRRLSDAYIELYSNGTLLTLELFQRLLEAGLSSFRITRHEGSKHLPLDDYFEHLTPAERSRLTLQDYRDMELTNRGGALGHIGNPSPTLIPCQIPEFLMVIDVTGNVLTCFEDVQKQWIVGNITQASLMEIWNSQPYVTLRQQLSAGFRSSYPHCRHCNRRQTLKPEGRACMS